MKRWIKFELLNDAENRFCASINSKGRHGGSPSYLHLSLYRWHVTIFLPAWLSLNPAVDGDRLHRSQYGISLYGNHLCLRFGQQPDNGEHERYWGCFLPWAEWRFVEHVFLNEDGSVHASLPEPNWLCVPDSDRCAVRNQYDAAHEAAKSSVPARRFTFFDYDDQLIIATCYVEQRRWKRGISWCRWLSWFWPDQRRTSMDISFSAQVGERKNTWKGGTLGHSIDVSPGETMEHAFKRYCVKHLLTFAALFD
jgi:hypothetical protein